MSHKFNKMLYGHRKNEKLSRFTDLLLFLAGSKSSKFNVISINLLSPKGNEMNMHEIIFIQYKICLDPSMAGIPIERLVFSDRKVQECGRYLLAGEALTDDLGVLVHQQGRSRFLVGRTPANAGRCRLRCKHI